MDGEKKGYYWNIDRIVWLILGLLLAGALIWLVKYLKEALLPFFVACAIAYLMQPLLGYNQRILRRKGRVLASIMTVLEVTIVIGGILWATIPSIVSQLAELSKIMADISAGRIKLPSELAPIVHLVDKYLNPDYLYATLSEIRFETIITKGSSLLESSIDVIIHCLAWALTLIYVLFILIDYPEIVSGFEKIVPLKYRPKFVVILRDIGNRMDHYFRGQGLVALCAMVLYSVGFLIVGLPLAIPMGVLVGILYMIPYFQYVTLIPVALICFIYSLGGSFDFWPELGKCLLVYVMSQCTCDYLITPHVMGRELGLNPAIILLSLSVWGSLLGIIGMIIALPVTALLMTYYEHYISNKK